MYDRDLFAFRVNSRNDMSPAPSGLELDHVFIVVSPQASEAQFLQKAGFTISSDVTRHTGQGTASVFSRFDNAYIEFVWIEDYNVLKQADSELASRMMRDREDTSPFGFALRQTDYTEVDLPFRTRPYRADWMQPGSEIRIAEGQPHYRTSSVFGS